MSLNPSRASRTAWSAGGPAGHLTPRVGAALLLVLGLLLASTGCGMHVQTNEPYTPADGINIDVGGPGTASVVHVRNLMIISRKPGSGVLSGSLVGDSRDSLTEVSGIALKMDGSDGAPFTATITDTVSLGNGALVVLTDRAPIPVTSADLAPGLTARVTLRFENAGETTLRIPVVDGNEPQYRSISPAPSPSSSPSS